ncbi:MAG: hypothetical protein M1358_24500 [Chloroflexi bacterium]|nr:hypothetical protein [Chloroflexota bacterium]
MESWQRQRWSIAGGQLIARPESPVRIDVDDHVVVIGTHTQLQEIDTSPLANQLKEALQNA